MDIYWWIWGLTVVVVMIVFSTLRAFTPYKCYFCGEEMECYYDEKYRAFYYECPKCGHKEVYHG